MPVPFEGFDWSTFWDDCDYARETYVSDPPTEELISSIESELGYRLPESYLVMAKNQNGGIPRDLNFPTKTPTSWAEDHVGITGILGIGRIKSSSLCGELGSKFMQEEWGYPEFGICICDCPSAGHDMIMLDYSECGPNGEPRVVHVDQENVPVHAPCTRSEGLFPRID
jgi:SMI1-KNR4 cell-wall